MSCLLRSFVLGEDWSGLFAHLGWRRLKPNRWSDGDCEVILSSKARSAPSIGFVVRQPATWRRIATLIEPQADPSDQSGLVVRTPAGLVITFSQDATARDIGSRDLIMNHAALNVVDLSAERAWFEELLDVRPVLARDSVFEPVKATLLADVHLFRSPGFYVTIRQWGVRPQVDHVGWMCRSMSVVDRVADIISRNLGWSFVCEPTEIDGSYLFHFRGPDDLVHDFFCPSDELCQLATES